MIYFVKSGDHVKIGFSENPRNRVIEVAGGCPLPAEVLLIMNGGHSDEKALHDLFKKYKVKGEWFIFSAEIIVFIREKQKIDRRYEFGFLDNFEDFKSGEQIKRLRHKHKFNLRQLGVVLGITAQSVKEIETREKSGSVSLKILKRVGNAMGYRFEYRFYPLKEVQERAQVIMELEGKSTGDLPKRSC